MIVDLDVAIVRLLFAKETGELKCGELKGVIEVLKRLSHHIGEDLEHKTGAWIEQEVFLAKEHGIDACQSARCSVCNKYHTTPYLYYFDNFNYCPNCGAKMEEENRCVI